MATYREGSMGTYERPSHVHTRTPHVLHSCGTGWKASHTTSLVSFAVQQIARDSQGLPTHLYLVIDFRFTWTSSCTLPNRTTTSGTVVRRIDASPSSSYFHPIQHRDFTTAVNRAAGNDSSTTPCMLASLRCPPLPTIISVASGGSDQLLLDSILFYSSIYSCDSR